MMTSFDGIEVCRLLASFVSNSLTKKVGINYIGVYLSRFENVSQAN